MKLRTLPQAILLLTIIASFVSSNLIYAKNAIFATVALTGQSSDSEIITLMGLENRKKMMLLFNPALRNLANKDFELAIQNQLIMEKLLSLQIGRQIGAANLEAEKDQYIKHLESAQNLKQGYFREVLARNGVAYNTFEDYIIGEIIKNKYLQSVQRGISATKDEVLMLTLLTEEAMRPKISAYVIKFENKDNLDTKRSLKYLLESKDLIKNINNPEYFKQYGIKASIRKIDESISKINEVYLGILLSMQENTFSKIVKVDSDHDQIIFLDSKLLNISDQQIQKFNSIVVNQRLAAEFEKFIATLKSSSIVVQKIK